MTPSVGILCKEGVVIAAKKQTISKLLDFEKASEKMYKIDSHIVLSATGLASDANTLIEYARDSALTFYKTFRELVNVEQLVQQICDYKQLHTQYGSYRPYGVAFMIAGYDKIKGFQLYCTDPSGNYSVWKANVIGSNNANGISYLKEEYKENLNLE